MKVAKSLLLFCPLSLLFGCTHVNSTKTADAQGQAQTKPRDQIAMELGAIAESNGDELFAAQFYDQAMKLKPKEVAPVLSLARMIKKKGNLAAAKQLYIKALRLDPHNPAIYRGLGDIAAARNEFDDALGFYNRTMNLNPGDSKTLNKIAILLDKSDHHALAQQFYIDIIEHDKAESAKAQNNLAVSLALSGRLNESLQLLDTHDYSKPNTDIMQNNINKIKSIATIENAPRISSERKTALQKELTQSLMPSGYQRFELSDNTRDNLHELLREQYVKREARENYAQRDMIQAIKMAASADEEQIIQLAGADVSSSDFASISNLMPQTKISFNQTQPSITFDAKKIEVTAQTPGIEAEAKVHLTATQTAPEKIKIVAKKNEAPRTITIVKETAILPVPNNLTPAPVAETKTTQPAKTVAKKRSFGPFSWSRANRVKHWKTEQAKSQQAIKHKRGGLFGWSRKNRTAVPAIVAQNAATTAITEATATTEAAIINNVAKPKPSEEDVQTMLSLFEEEASKTERQVIAKADKEIIQETSEATPQKVEQRLEPVDDEEMQNDVDGHMPLMVDKPKVSQPKITKTKTTVEATPVKPKVTVTETTPATSTSTSTPTSTATAVPAATPAATPEATPTVTATPTLTTNPSQAQAPATAGNEKGTETEEVHTQTTSSQPEVKATEAQEHVQPKTSEPAAIQMQEEPKATEPTQAEPVVAEPQAKAEPESEPELKPEAEVKPTSTETTLEKPTVPEPQAQVEPAVNEPALNTPAVTEPEVQVAPSTDEPTVVAPTENETEAQVAPNASEPSASESSTNEPKATEKEVQAPATSSTPAEESKPAVSEVKMEAISN